MTQEKELRGLANRHLGYCTMNTSTTIIGVDEFIQALVKRYYLLDKEGARRDEQMVNTPKKCHCDRICFSPCDKADSKCLPVIFYSVEDKGE